MRKCPRILTSLLLALPLAAVAEVPVVDGGSGSSYPPAGYGTSGAYAGGGAQAPTSAQGQLFMQLQQMQDEIAQLRGLVEEQQNEIQRLKQESLARYQDLDSRLQGGAAGAQAPAQNSPADGAINAAGTPAAPAQQAPAASNEPADPANEKLYYDAAFDLIKAKDFPKASQAFEGFLRKFPQSQYAGNAQYWLGEVNLAQNDLQGAGKAFARVAANYPNHAKVPDSLFKLADVERRLGNTDKARDILKQLIAQYPGSSAAQLAQRDLQRL
ncbi:MULTISPECIES: tol-pal system protein YbgF [unclassified Pseudomonas]|uniref:tol-pal system protein YbgF n=1 Tax=unclassified Pseudomonas TaxID=196821 RepID=UPI00244AB05C|nr:MULTISPECIES: tol-pal system protein YbgF [unclassified Pseudomonas]MDG9930801.1 tol-pal system protein YbgF [Pseudomonas sp. GD04042]MDH0485190.1 tol-pal system protein YbgF [Pseudomonas sp. GD04015]MDH0605560.1 tol-pal system protein YbgF [Pseudomonas sp. GD03869]MDH0893818.1 tol-pal system protein YbgF [Pseudomonas sp. GD03875]MDH1064337.1 tol-pal system protein YbgF [Pseudomonas sp. GD03985]